MKNKSSLLKNTPAIQIDNKELFNTYFDAVYLINLEKRKDRFDHFKNSAAKIEFDHQNLKIIKAVDGQSLTPSNNWSLPIGHLGCIESHLLVLEDARINKYDKILVLEDDFTFHKHFFKTVSKAILNLPEQWDMLYLYGLHLIKPQLFMPGLVKAPKVLTTTAYALNKKSILKIEAILSERAWEIDVMLAAAQVVGKLDCYAVENWAGYAYNNYSDITEKHEKPRGREYVKIWWDFKSFVKKLIK